MELSAKAVHHAEFFLVLVIFAYTESLLRTVPYVIPGAPAVAFLLTIATLAFVLTYILLYVKRSSRFRPSTVSLALHAESFAVLLFSVLFFAISGPFLFPLLVNLLRFFVSFGIFFTVFIPLFFLAFLGALLWRKNRRAALVTFAVLLLLLILIYSSSFIVGSFTLDDEVLIASRSAALVMHGINPYTVSMVPMLYQNASIGLTITTQNNIVGVLDYPALFVLSTLPFYVTAPQTLAGFGNVASVREASVFLFILLLSIAFSLDRKDLAGPKLALMAFFIIAIWQIAAITTYLMLALLVIAYMKMDSEYAWIPLGLCASIQEELWLPVFFLLVYSIGSLGLKRGAKNVIGTAAVFLVLNGYFILTAPTAYFGNVLTPLGHYLFPGDASTISFFISQAFPLLLSTYSQLFIISALLLALLLLYWNRKELVPVFSAIPFLLLQHSLPAYYVTFFLLLMLPVSSVAHRRGWGERLLKRHMPSTLAVAAILVGALILLPYSSHLSWVNNFNVSQSDTRLSLNSSSMSTAYNAVLHYGPMKNNTVYVVALALDSQMRGGFRGFINQSIIATPRTCGSNDYDCLTNVNVLTLPRNSSSYNLTVSVPWSNSTTPIVYMSVVLYNGDYFYSSPGVYNSSV